MSSLGDLFLNPQPVERRHPLFDPSPLELFLKDGSASTKAAPPCAVRFDKDKVFWAMQNLSVEEAVRHFAVIGCIGSGKSTALDLFLQSIAPRFRPGRKPPEQLIVFDAKGDLIPKLAAWGHKLGRENVWLLNPFDVRSAVWDIAEAVTEPATARYVASLFVPEEKQSQAPFFAQAAQQLVNAVLLALNATAPGQWTFRDLLCALDSRKRIAALCEVHSTSRSLAGAILKDKRHALGVMSTLSTKMARFREVAALWHTAPKSARRFSVKKFLKRPGVLVLGYDPVLKESLWPINATVLRALTQEVLRGPETLYPRHWFVLDEFRSMENVECVRDLLNTGRSKGVSVTLGVQSIDGLVELYREEGTNAILEACLHKTFLSAGGPKTAEWAERFINKVRRVEKVITETRGPGGHSTSVQYTLQDRSILTAGYFLNLPMPQPDGVFSGVHHLPSTRCFLVTELPFEQVLSWRKPQAKVPAMKRRMEISDQHIIPWTETEESHFLTQLPSSEAVDLRRPEPQDKTKENQAAPQFILPEHDRQTGAPQSESPPDAFPSYDGTGTGQFPKTTETPPTPPPAKGPPKDSNSQTPGCFTPPEHQMPDDETGADSQD